MKIVLLLALLTVSECGSRNIVGQTGQNVTLPCTYNFKYYRVLSVCWGRGDLPLSGCNNQLISTDGLKVKEGTRASSRYQLLGRLDEGDVSLTILNVTDSDAGRYGCRVDISGWSNDDKHHSDLTVETVSECGSSKSVVGQTGQNVILSCTYNFKYYRALSVCWGRGDLPLSGCNNQLISTDGLKVKEGTRASSRYQLLGRLDEGDVSLTILNVTDSDAGRYECRVDISGWFSDDKHHFDLTVETGGNSSSTTSTTISTSTISTSTSSTSTSTSSSRSVVVPMLICCVLLLLFFITFFILMRRRRSQTTRTTTDQLEENVYVVMQGNRSNEKQEKEEESPYVVCNPAVPMKTPVTQQISVDVEDIYV